MAIRYTAETHVEIAHKGINGVLHGHSLGVAATTTHPVDLDVWKTTLHQNCQFLNAGPLEETVGRTFEDIAHALLERMPLADTITITLPTERHALSVDRT